MEFKSRLIAASLILLGGFAYFAASDDSGTTKTNRSKRVEVAAVSAVKDARSLRFSGVTRSAQRARLAFPMAARLVERPVQIGDTVKRGQLLARVEDQEFKNALATASGSLAELEARRAQTERDLERVEKLAAAKAATPEEVEKTRAGVEALSAGTLAAQGRVSETKRWLAETVIRAPFDGTITEVFLEPGELATPGRPVLTLSGAGAVELQVELPESVIPRLVVDQDVDVLLPILGEQPIKGKITSLGKIAGGVGQLFPAVIELPASASAVGGATAELILAVGDDQVLAVPVAAVVNPGGRKPTLFRVKSATVERIAIEVGHLIGDRVTVQGPLQVGDLVVVGGQRGLIDGEAVEVVP